MSKNKILIAAVLIILTFIFANLSNWIEDRQTFLIIRNSMLGLEFFFLVFLIIRKYKK